MSPSAGLLVFVMATALFAQQAPDITALEARGEAEFAQRDCQAAVVTLGEAVAAAQADSGQSAHLDLDYRRIGICRARFGDFDGALAAYTNGWKASETSHDDEMLAENIHGAALMLQRLGRVAEAFPLAQREYELTQKCGHPAHMIRAMWLVAEMQIDSGKVRQGIQLLEAALQISRASNDKSGTAILLDNLAIRYYMLGDPETAIAMETAILPLTDPANKPALAITFSNLGEMQLDSGNASAAAVSLAKAFEAASSPDAARVRIAVLTNLARVALDAGRLTEADARSQQALDLSRKMKIPNLESAVQRFRADVLLAHPDPARPSGALEAADDALRLGREAASGLRIYEALFSRGEAGDALGQHEAAARDFDEAIAVSENLRAESSGEAADLRGAFERVVPLYRASVKNLLLRNLPADGLRRAEQAKARVLMDLLLRGGVDERALMTPAQTDERNRLRRNLAAANGKALASPSPAAARAAEAATGLLRQFERDLFASHPELALQSVKFQPAGPEQLAALLPDERTALLDYFTLPSGVALFVVRKSRVSAFVLPDPGNTLAAEIHRFRLQLASRDFDYKPAARHLFDRLIGPALPALGPAADWIISPDGALWEVPFAALLNPSGHHVLEDHAVTLVPSLTAALQLRLRSYPAGAARIPLLAIGNPLPSASPLPDAAEEASRIAAGFSAPGAHVLTGAAASREAFLAQAQDARVIHVAAHGGLNDRDPLSSFIDFGSGSAGGMLTARDIMDLHLHADLVVLSACDTALGAARPGEGMIGMGWALAVAGASSSVLSYWKIDSAASKEFMVGLYRQLPASAAAPALREAALRTMRSPGHRHPFYWAPFTVWGS